MDTLRINLVRQAESMTSHRRTQQSFRERYEQSLKGNEYFLTMKYFGRPLAFPLVLLFEKTPITANQVSLLGGACWAVGMILLLLISPTNCFGAGLAALCLLLGGLLDIADGGIARVRNTFSMRGAYLDFVLHHIFNPLLPVCIGYFLSQTGHEWFLFLGIAAVPGGWGFSQTAKQCILLKNRKLVNESRRLNERDYHSLFFDSSEVLQPVSAKPGIIEIIKKLPSEFFFPGNFFTFPAAITLDIILAKGGVSYPYPASTLLFIFYSGALMLSIPFRVHREFLALKQEDDK